ncbi:MAG: hypothetical protein AAFY08_15670, partial [Planctomycetota bacterium]
PKKKRPSRKGVANKEVTPGGPAPTKRCPHCASTELRSVRVLYDSDKAGYAAAGVAPDGKPYNHLVRRLYRCQWCGRHTSFAEYGMKRKK